MENRSLGKTGYKSSVLALGGAALWDVTQDEADTAIRMTLDHGINYFDVSPRYGQAEMRLGPWIEKHRKEIFLACKTADRGKTKAWESIRRSLDRLRTDYFDLFQFHMVSDTETLNVVLGPGGALEAVLEAKDKGLVRCIGITGHRPYVQIEALNRFEFDTICFPLNRVISARPNDYSDFSFLMDVAHEKGVGIIAIKAVAKQPWGLGPHMYRTWYEPFSNQIDIDKGIWYTLSQSVSTAVMPADVRLWPAVIDAAERFELQDTFEQEAAIMEIAGCKHIFPSGWLIP